MPFPLMAVGAAMGGIGILGSALGLRKNAKYKIPNTVAKYGNAQHNMQNALKGLGDNSAFGFASMAQNASRFSNASGMNSQIGLEMARRNSRQQTDNLLMGAFRDSTELGFRAASQYDNMKFNFDRDQMSQRMSFMNNLTSLGGNMLMMGAFKGGGGQGMDDFARSQAASQFAGEHDWAGDFSDMYSGLDDLGEMDFKFEMPYRNQITGQNAWR